MARLLEQGDRMLWRPAGKPELGEPFGTVDPGEPSAQTDDPCIELPDPIVAATTGERFPRSLVAVGTVGRDDPVTGPEQLLAVQIEIGRERQGLASIEQRRERLTEDLDQAVAVGVEGPQHRLAGADTIGDRLEG